MRFASTELLERLHEAATVAEAHGFLNSANAYRRMIDAELARVAQQSCEAENARPLNELGMVRSAFIAAE